jgi:MFS family permease
MKTFTQDKYSRLIITTGVAWGVIQTLAATYAAEVVPSAIRACLLSNVNMCWVIGQLLGTGILRSLVHNDSEWSYRLPFALQWAFAVPLLIAITFAPESPCKLHHVFISYTKLTHSCRVAHPS